MTTIDRYEHRMMKRDRHVEETIDEVKPGTRRSNRTRRCLKKHLHKTQRQYDRAIVLCFDGVPLPG